MAASAKFSFKGIIATAFTPFNNDSVRSLNLSVVPQYAEYFSTKGFSAVLINGTYGEGMAMTTNERIQVAEAWSQAVKKTQQQLIVQVGGTNLQDVKILARHAQIVGAKALLCLPELYYKPKTVDELIDYLREVGSSAPEVPLFYYHSPDVTGVTVNMAEFLNKVENKIPSLAGVKFGNAKLDDCSQALRAAGNRYKVVLANNFVLPASTIIGVDTFMPTSINVAPELVTKIVDLAQNGNLSEAEDYQKQLGSMLDELAALNKGVPLSPMKYLTTYLTPINVGPTRKPLRSFDTPQEQTQIASLARKFEGLRW